MTTTTTTLLQKHPLKGSREFHLLDDEIQCNIKSPLKTETLNVVLHILDPEPVVTGSILSFVSQVNREPLVKLFLNKPDKPSFEHFVKTLQERITEEDFGRFRMRKEGTNVVVNIERLEKDIRQLKKYVDVSSIAPFMSALDTLKAQPDSLDHLNAVARAFNELGFMQGQVLTYAPYINHLLSGGHDI